MFYSHYIARSTCISCCS